MSYGLLPALNKGGPMDQWVLLVSVIFFITNVVVYSNNFLKTIGTFFYIKFRDDNKKLHPCLVDFQSLPEPEKNYNLAMSENQLQ